MSDVKSKIVCRLIELVTNEVKIKLKKLILTKIVEKVKDYLYIFQNIIENIM